MMHLGLTRTAREATVSLGALLLVLPAVVFLLAALLRMLQPVQHQPAATAAAVMAVFAGTPRPVLRVLLLLCPLVALIVAAADQRRRWSDDPAWREDVWALAGACGRVLRRPLAVATVLALLASAGWLALVVMHAITG